MLKKITFTLLIITILLCLACAQKNAENNLENSKQIAKNVVHATSLGLGDLCVLEESKMEKIELIRKFIAPIRFYSDKTGYFYVYDINCNNIAHATQPDLVGQNLYNYQDSKGKYVIRKLSEKAQKGGGFVEFYWQKPNDETEYKKMGYVEMIPGTDYFIGTGVYLE